MKERPPDHAEAYLHCLITTRAGVNCRTKTLTAEKLATRLVGCRVQ